MELTISRYKETQGKQKISETKILEGNTNNETQILGNTVYLNRPKITVKRSEKTI